jgi:hypothetical protein
MRNNNKIKLLVIFAAILAGALATLLYLIFIGDSKLVAHLVVATYNNI